MKTTVGGRAWDDGVLPNFLINKNIEQSRRKVDYLLDDPEGRRQRWLNGLYLFNGGAPL